MPPANRRHALTGLPFVLVVSLPLVVPSSVPAGAVLAADEVSVNAKTARCESGADAVGARDRDQRRDDQRPRRTERGESAPGAKGCKTRDG